MHRTTAQPQSFPAQPAWNSFAALGFIAGIFCGIVAPAGLFWFPPLQPPQLAWVSTVIASSFLGAIAGAAIGIISGVRHDKHFLIDGGARPVGPRQGSARMED